MTAGSNTWGMNLFKLEQAFYIFFDALTYQICALFLLVPIFLKRLTFYTIWTVATAAHEISTYFWLLQIIFARSSSKWLIIDSYNSILFRGSSRTYLSSVVYSLAVRSVVALFIPWINLFFASKLLYDSFFSERLSFLQATKQPRDYKNPSCALHPIACLKILGKEII